MIPLLAPGLDLLGYVAAIFSCAAFFPQVVRTWRTRSVGDISLSMFLINSAGAGLWLWYGFLAGSVPIISANGIILTLSLCMLTMKLKFGHQQTGG
ncbi:MAG: SemiSWEET transporter [Magnetococcales bacterium]|nr:SemiSWEET transporter [Magnetococcales bacterium]MBF0321961.1 SemiSWEET transporter [Magnetococcales bacterium]